jgi:hypothetical protein
MTAPGIDFSRAARQERHRAARANQARGILLATVAYIGVLHWTYRDLVAPNYAYMGMAKRSLNWPAYLVAVACVLGAALILPRSIRAVSDFVQLAVFVLVTAPSILVAQHAPTLSVVRATILALVLLLCTALIRAGVIQIRGRLERIAWRPLQVNSRPYWIAVGAGTGVIYVLLITTLHPEPTLRSFTDVYAVRAQYKAALASVPIMGYVVPLLYNVANPLWMTRGLMRGSVLSFLVGALGQVAIFTVTAHRAVVFSSIAVPLLWLAWHGRLLRPPRFVMLVSLGVALSVTVDLLTHSLRTTPVLVTRLIAIPGSLTSAYVAVFTDRPKGLFATVIPGIRNAYPEQPFLLVGKLFFHQDGNSANVNFFGDGFFNLGWAGMAIAATAVAVLLAVVDVSTRHLPMPAPILFFAAPTIALTNSSVFTTLLTHGALAVCVAALLLPGSALARDDESIWHRSGRRWRQFLAHRSADHQGLRT